jgi:hypothetical protein
MSQALTLLLITIATGSGDPNGALEDPLTPGIIRATREALGAETRVVSKQLQAPPDDAAVTELGAQLHADAVIEVEWSLPDHLKTTIRMRRSGGTRWLDRDIGFRENDDPDERSRTVGFAIASMLPEYVARPEVSATAEGPAPPSVQRKESPSKSTETHEATAVLEKPVHHANSTSLSGLAAFGVDDRGGGFGGVFDYRRELAPALSLRVGVSGRFGQTPASEVSTRFLSGGVGLAWSSWRSNSGRAALGLRLDAQMVVVEFIYQSPTGAADKQKFLPGGTLALEGSYFFTRAVAVAIAAGGEAVFGQTNVFVGAQRTTSLAPLHPVVELGLRVGF